MEAFVQVAIKAARAAGTLLMQRFGKQHDMTDDAINPSTKEDKASEDIIIETIIEAFPGHNILGEECGKQDHGSKFTWIIDPIDGTVNYVEGRDTFSVSIGLAKNDEVIVGVVYLPKRDELFIATKDGGATMNGQPIKVNNHDSLTTANITLSTYPGASQDEKLDTAILMAIPRVRLLTIDKRDEEFGRGSMAAEFCYLACGRLDGLIRLKQKPWDVAAGSLIAAEAGAVMKNLAGEECSVYEGDYVAANPALYERIEGILRR